MRSRSIKAIISFMAICYLLSCKKYLDEKSNKQLSTPDTIEDLQALLDNDEMLRSAVAATQIGTDEYFVPVSLWETRPDLQKFGYVWDAQLNDEDDWNLQYQIVLVANTVLDRVDKIATGQRADEIKGTALFLRAHSFFQIAQLYAVQYDQNTADQDLGIVLRLEADFSVPSKRASVKQTYDQIITDLEQAVTLLPQVASSSTRPNKAAGYALLGRTYLQMGDYQKARSAAEQSLDLYNVLIDYNDMTEVTPASDNPILKTGILNKEILFYQVDNRSLSRHPNARVDSVLYNTYDSNDIRKKAFFRKNTTEDVYHFKASYVGAIGNFTGLNTPEVYLLKAEANARLGNAQLAMQTVSALLSKRYKTGTTPLLNAATPEQALLIVLAERKKELLFRGIRWADLKRLNQDPATAITVKRNLNGTVYTFPPNDLRYTLLIPSRVMQLSALVQNPR